MQIGRKIYFDKLTGNVLLDTGERSGNVIETTQEQDFASYIVLSERIPESVGYIQLEYGQDNDKFGKYPFHINTETNTIIWLVNEVADLDAYKNAKIEQLNYFCQQSILGTFKSSTLGIEHTYPADEEAQRNVSGAVALIAADKNNTNTLLDQLPWKTYDAGDLVHTREQTIQLGTDLMIHISTNIQKFRLLRQQVLAVVTSETAKAEIDTIIW